ncbi:MAG: DUF1501 domain-containing protein, partial [Myxococcota bacterium]|nr:DUF1501 domain-containing protein [Myxococcota bacterium]
MEWTRRSLLKGAGGLLGLHLAGWPARAADALLADLDGNDGDPRFVLVQLRGGLDGLAAVPAVGDPRFVSARAGLAETEGRAPLPLNDFFGLHPALETLHGLYGRGEMLAVHAVATPYRDRSHFDGQNLLESGGTRAFHLDRGWLGRALDAAAAGAVGTGATTPASGLALGSALPLVLRGEQPAASWSPTSLPAPAPRLLSAVERLYAGDPALGRALDQARRAQAVIGRPEMPRRRDAFPVMARAAATFLADPDGPRVAVLDLDGFDSHSLQALRLGGLQRSLSLLDQGMGALRDGLGPLWSRTVVLAHTE